MEISTIVEALGLMLGGSGIGCLFTINYARKKALGEARSAENEATKAVQDVYQELVEDVKRDREDQRTYIAELKEDRNHLRSDRDELRKENLKMRKATKQLQEDFQEMKREVARQGRKLGEVSPFICSRMGCSDRIKSSISELDTQHTVKKSKKLNNKTEE